MIPHPDSASFFLSPYSCGMKLALHTHPCSGPPPGSGRLCPSLCVFFLTFHLESRTSYVFPTPHLHPCCKESSRAEIYFFPQRKAERTGYQVKRWRSPWNAGQPHHSGGPNSEDSYPKNFSPPFP